MDPITLASLGLTAGSVLANIFQDDAQQKAREEALRNAAMTQMAFDARSGQIVNNAAGRYRDFGGKMAGEGSRLAELFNSQATTPMGAGSTVAMPNAPKAQSGIMANEQNRASGVARAFAGQQGKALGDVRSFGNTLGAAQRGVMRDSQDLGQNIMFAQNAMNLLPGQLSAAQNAGSGWGLAGDLMRGAGNIGLSYGLTSPVPGKAIPGYFQGGSLVPSFGTLSKMFA